MERCENPACNRCISKRRSFIRVEGRIFCCEACHTDWLTQSKRLEAVAHRFHDPFYPPRRESPR